MNATTDQTRLDEIDQRHAEQGRITNESVVWLIEQLKAAQAVQGQLNSTQDILRRSYAALPDGCYVSDASIGLPEMIASFAIKLKAAQEEFNERTCEIVILNSQAMACSKPVADGVRKLQAENERLKAQWSLIEEPLNDGQDITFLKHMGDKEEFEVQVTGDCFIASQNEDLSAALKEATEKYAKWFEETE